ncbi:hypothetical protein DR950_18305 [Kitasatospora xanthocidica]|uniref:Uncharacterized protein n=1 Tax=Kitasatospora xanthocidica TaxID=83382 RepID=A0A372ZU94_9ACTN|nr:hypothetical protein [Kitasatospora xanthocidica]RGD59486.1 hypothetical protein DR950_18305 [Kitasatospora xanthocidica]
MAISCEGVLRVIAERRRAGLTVESECDSPISGQEAVRALILLADSERIDLRRSGKSPASGSDDAEGDASS